MFAVRRLLTLTILCAVSTLIVGCEDKEEKLKLAYRVFMADHEYSFGDRSDWNYRYNSNRNELTVFNKEPDISVGYLADEQDNCVFRFIIMKRDSEGSLDFTQNSEARVISIDANRVYLSAAKTRDGFVYLTALESTFQKIGSDGLNGSQQPVERVIRTANQWTTRSLDDA